VGVFLLQNDPKTERTNEQYNYEIFLRQLNDGFGEVNKLTHTTGLLKNELFQYIRSLIHFFILHGVDMTSFLTPNHFISVTPFCSL